LLNDKAIVLNDCRLNNGCTGAFGNLSRVDISLLLGYNFFTFFEQLWGSGQDLKIPKGGVGTR